MEIEQLLTMPTSQLVVKVDRLWQKAFDSRDNADMDNFSALFDRCNIEVRTCIDTIRTQDYDMMHRFYWEQILATFKKRGGRSTFQKSSSLTFRDNVPAFGAGVVLNKTK